MKFVMKKYLAKRNFIEYLKKNQIKHCEYIEENQQNIAINYLGCEESPDKILEGNVCFYEDEMEARIYFNQTAAKWTRESLFQQELMRLLNFINARVWLRVSDGIGDTLYKPHTLFSPRIYMSEDGACDIMITSIISYNLYELVQVEVEDYITVYCPELLNKLSKPIFGVVLGQITAEQSMLYIKNELNV